MIESLLGAPFGFGKASRNKLRFQPKVLEHRQQSLKISACRATFWKLPFQPILR